MINAELAERLSKYDWGDIGKKLTAFVIHYMNYCAGKKFSDWNLPEGYKAEDVAYKAITDVLSGVRNWSPDRHPDLLKYLQFSVCRSIISNLYAKSEGKKTNQISQGDCFSPEQEDVFDYYTENQINFGLHFEQSVDNKVFLDRLDVELRTDETAQMVLLSILDGSANREIAADLSITISDVSNAKKRIKRAADKILTSLN